MESGQVPEDDFEMPEELLSDEDEEEHHQGAMPEGRQRKQERHAEHMVRSMERASSPFSGDREFLPLIGTTTMPDGKFTIKVNSK
uniref:Fido domain-containing protein n=1 Tax=Globodera rostochiensis TaxID=31243 RepID=A0A914HGW5_GLORO